MIWGIVMNESKSEWLGVVKTICVTVVVILIVRIFFFTPVVVEGASMQPTFHSGDRIIVSKQSSIERLDVIVFKANEHENYIKRVIGLPGEHVAYMNDYLLINGEVVEEPYLDDYKLHIPLDTTLTENFTLETYTGYTVIPEGYVFVLGDNRKKSTDSRDPSLGLVAFDSILGEVEMIVFPFDHSGLVK